MARIVLVRHGRASADGEDYDVLSPVGHEQARVVGGELATRRLDVERLRTGTLRRQVDSAASALAVWGLDVEPVVDERWDEYDHLDVVKHHAPASALERVGDIGFQAVLDAALFAWIEAGEDTPTALPWPEFDARAQAAAASVADGLGKGRDAVVFTSGGVVAAIAARLLDAGPASFVALNRVMVNASATTLLSGRRGLTLATFNDHSYLEQPTYR